MNTKIIVASLAGSALGVELMEQSDYEFMKYVSEYGKSYGTKAEFEFRKNIFKQTLADIEQINSQNGTSTVGINFLADMTK